jgi:hypothetical protein
MATRTISGDTHPGARPTIGRNRLIGIVLAVLAAAAVIFALTQMRGTRGPNRGPASDYGHRVDQTTPARDVPTGTERPSAPRAPMAPRTTPAP